MACNNTQEILIAKSLCLELVIDYGEWNVIHGATISLLPIEFYLFYAYIDGVLL